MRVVLILAKIVLACESSPTTVVPPRTESGLPPPTPPIDPTAVLENPTIQQVGDQEGTNPGTIATGGSDPMVRVAMGKRPRLRIEALRQSPGMCVGSGKTYPGASDTLAHNAGLVRAAAHHAVDMLGKSYFSHSTPDGSWSGKRARGQWIHRPPGWGELSCADIPQGVQIHRGPGAGYSHEWVVGVRGWTLQSDQRAALGGHRNRHSQQGRR